MYVRTAWRAHLVVLGPGAHYNRQYFAAQCIHKELLGYVIPAIGILERQIELVVVIEYIEAFVGGTAWALVIAASAVDVHLRKRENFERYV